MNETESQEILTYYKTKICHQKDSNQVWDQVYSVDHRREISTLFDLLGSKEKVIAYLYDFDQKMTAAHLTWNLKTAVRHAEKYQEPHNKWGPSKATRKNKWEV